MIRHRPNKSGPVPQGCPLEYQPKTPGGSLDPANSLVLKDPRSGVFGDLKRDLEIFPPKF